MSKSKSNSTSKSEKIFINKEDLRDYIHSIHDDLRNSGAGYGRTGLKIFSVFYGLKLIKPNLNKLKLTDKQKKTLDWDELVKRVNNINENNKGEIIKYIDEEVLEVLWKLKDEEKNELGYFIFHQIPRDLKDDIWKNLIPKIDKIPVGYNTDDHSVNLSGKVWEYFVGRDKTAISELGAFFTDRPVTDFCFNKVKPKLNEDDEENKLNIQTMIDPFAGSGGFTLGYANYLREHYPNINWKDNVDNIYHFDMEEDVVNMTGLEMFAVTGHFPKRSNNFKRQNSFTSEFIGNNGITHYKNVYANPPYGGDKNTKTAEDIKRDKLISYLKNLKDDMTDVLKEQLTRLLKEKKEEESKRKAETTVNLKTCSKRIRDFAKKHNIDNANDKESCSLILLMDLLDKSGVCCAVLKEGVFFDSKYSKVREVLLKNYNVTNVISVPQNAFENTSTKTSIIIFYNNGCVLSVDDKSNQKNLKTNSSGKTKKVEFSELIIHNINSDEFEINDDGEAVLIKTKDEFDYIEEKKCCTATLKQIEENLTKDKCIYSLNYKDYMDYKVVCPDDYEMKKLSEYLEFEKKSKRNASFATENGKYRFYTSSDKIKKCDECDFTDDKLKLIFGDGGKGSLFIDTKFSCSDHNIVCTSENKYNLLYIYDYIKINWDDFIMKNFNGSVLANIGKDKINNMEIPFPKDINKLKPQLDKLYKIHQQIMSDTDAIPEKEKNICEIIKKATEEGKKGVDYEEYKLGDNIKTLDGTYNTKDMNNKGNIPFYNASINNPIGFIEKECFDDKKYILFVKSGGNSSNKISNTHALGLPLLVKGKCASNVHVCKLNLLKNICNVEYLYYYMLILRPLIQENAKYSTGLGGVNMEHFKNIIIKVLTEKQMKKLKLQELFDEVDKLKEDLENNKKSYEKYMKELFKDFEEKDDDKNEEDTNLKSSKDDFLPQKKSSTFSSEKQKKKVKQTKKQESSESESDNSSDSNSDDSSTESESDIKPKKIIKPVKKVELSDSEKPKKKPKPVKKVELSSEESNNSSDSLGESEDAKPKKLIKKTK
jgi:type I restriction-modification system DNA methylase subunit